MPGPEIGMRVAIGGLVVLVLCVSGLVAVAVRRRQY
jgi:hypothetical protein